MDSMCGVTITRKRFNIILCLVFFLFALIILLDITHQSKMKKRVIFAITPTYARHIQKAELIRISHVVVQDQDIQWIVVEDSPSKTKLVTEFLGTAGLTSLRLPPIHLNIETQEEMKNLDGTKNRIHPRGARQRNFALQWLREQNKLKNDEKTWVFFMDDDNTYEMELFNEIKKIEDGRVGVWPVGLVGGLYYETPIINRMYRVIGFNSRWRPDRPFPIDMAAFAVSSRLLMDPKIIFNETAETGMQESSLLTQLLKSPNELQPMANLCKDINVWHTRSELPSVIFSI